VNVAFGELKKKVLRILSDQLIEVDSGDALLGGKTYSAELLSDAVHAALDAITSRIWKSATFDIASSVDESDVPEDAIDIEAVYDNTIAIFLPKLSMQVGITLSSVTGNGWTLYPTGKLKFINEIGSSGCTVYYSSGWMKPINDADLIEPPATTLTCLILFAASYCLILSSVEAADLGNFKTKVDSGQPTDNPAKDMSNFLLKRFEVELQRLPMMEKGRVQ